MDFYSRAGRRLGSITLDMQGILASDTPLAGPTVTFAGTGTAKYENPRVGRFDRQSCAFTSVSGPYAPLSVAVDGADLYAANHVNGRGTLTRHDASGKTTATQKLGDVVTKAIAVDKDKVFILGTADKDRAVIMGLDKGSLQESSRTDVTATGFPGAGAVMMGGQLYFPTVSSDAEGERLAPKLAHYSPSSGVTEAVPLTVEPAYLLRRHGGTLVVAHTYLNPSIKPMHAYRELSLVDASTKSISVITAPHGITHMEVVGDELLVLGLNADELPMLSVYDFGSRQWQGTFTLSDAGTEGTYSVAVVPLER